MFRVHKTSMTDLRFKSVHAYLTINDYISVCSEISNASSTSTPSVVAHYSPVHSEKSSSWYSKMLLNLHSYYNVQINYLTTIRTGNRIIINVLCHFS